MSARLTVTAAWRGCAATGLVDLRVRDDRALPPLILQPRDNDSHEVKSLALDQRLRSVPHSKTSRSAGYGPMPWICVRSVPAI